MLGIVVPVQLTILSLQKLTADYFQEVGDCILNINLDKLKYILPNYGNVTLSESAEIVNLLLKEDVLDYYNLMEPQKIGLTEFIFTDYQLKIMCFALCERLVRLGELTGTEFDIVTAVAKILHTEIKCDVGIHTMENLQLLNHNSDLYKNAMFTKYQGLDKYSAINIERMEFIKEQIVKNECLNTRTLDTTSSKIIVGSMIGGTFLCSYFIASVADFVVFDVVFA